MISYSSKIVKLENTFGLKDRPCSFINNFTHKEEKKLGFCSAILDGDSRFEVPHEILQASITSCRL